jgi:hypothetical protein
MMPRKRREDEKPSEILSMWLELSGKENVRNIRKYLIQHLDQPERLESVREVYKTLGETVTVEELRRKLHTVPPALK